MWLLLYVYCLDWSRCKTDYPLISRIRTSCYHEFNDHWPSHVGSICYFIYNNWVIIPRNNQGIIIQTEVVWKGLCPCSFVNQNSHQLSWNGKNIQIQFYRIFQKKLWVHIKQMFQIFLSNFLEWKHEINNMMCFIHASHPSG